jgi:two-component system, response regulator YesN
MIKVMIVDDEYLAREGMKRTVDWTTSGCEIIGEAENGDEAIERAKILKPDIIITDIKMPGIDGLAMCQEIRKFLGDCRFIVTTGYDQFEYAKGAVKINAVDFLLKPIDETELMAALNQAVEQHKRLKLESFAGRERVILDAMRRNFDSEEKMIFMLQKYGIAYRSVIIALIENDTYNSIMDYGKEAVLYNQNKKIKDIVHNHFKEDCHLVECHRDRVAAIINSCICGSIADLEDELKMIQKEIYNECEITVTIGLSNVNELFKISEAYSQAKKALSNKIYSGNNSIIQNVDETSAIVFKNTLMVDTKERLMAAIAARDRMKVEELLKKLYFDIFKYYRVEEDIIKKANVEIINEGLKLLKGYNIAVSDIFHDSLDIYKETASVVTLNELYQMASSYINKVLYAIREQRNEAEGCGMDKAVEYIRAHYCENISLGDVAKECYLSESYLSRKMKQVFGIGFTEYITKLRMEKAIEYLKEQNTKVTEISVRVGYPDYRYFSQLFRKHTGYSPSEYIKGKINLLSK